MEKYKAELATMEANMVDEKIVKTAVEWWAEKISGNEPHSNGDNSPVNRIAMMIADSGRKNITEDQLNFFKEELSQGIKEHFTENEYDLFLCVDYTPCTLLNKAAEKSGINVLNFPFKTDMRIYSNCVEVSDGYGQPWKEIGNSDV